MVWPLTAVVLADTSPISGELRYNLQLLAWVIGLAAGMQIICAIVEYIIGRQIDRTDGSAISRELWIQSRLIAVVTEISTVRRFVQKFVPLIAVFFLGYLYRDFQLYNKSDGYQMQIRHVYGPRRVQAIVIDEHGKFQGDPFLFHVCESEDDPQFEEGMRINVTFMESTDSTGECKSFAASSASHLGYSAVVNETTGKLVDFRETQ